MCLAGYPIRPNLEEAIAAFGSAELQAEDIIQIVDGLFKRVLILETLTGIDDFLYDGYSIQPSVSIVGRGVHLVSAFEKFLLLSAHDCMTARGSGQPFQILTKDIVTVSDRARINGRITYAEGMAELTLPSSIDAEGEFHQNFASLCASISTSRAWLESLDLYDYIAALRMHVVKAASDLGITESDVRRWSFGPHFIPSFKSLPFNNDAMSRRLLKACGEVVTQENLGATHALRTSSRGNNSQVSRGAFRAWRKDIDYEYHLHYWDNGAAIEFSLVVDHNNFAIR